MKITDSRAHNLLRWLDGMAADHTLLFEEMTLFRDTAAMIRQLQAAEQAAWYAGLDDGREQGRGKDHPSPSAPVGVSWADFWIAQGDWTTANDYATFEKAERWLLAQHPAAHPAITHCDNCGCDWLDNGLNPVGCPYCRQTAAVDEECAHCVGRIVPMTIDRPCDHYHGTRIVTQPRGSDNG